MSFLGLLLQIYKLWVFSNHFLNRIKHMLNTFLKRVFLGKQSYFKKVPYTSAYKHVDASSALFTSKRPLA